MKNKLFIIVMAVVALAFAFLPLLAFGQTNDPAFTADDEKIRDAIGKYSALKLFMVPLVTVLVMFARKLIGRIPDQLWPVIAPFLGVALDYAASKLGFWTGSIEAGAAMGGLAVWFSQLSKQTKELVKEGPTVTEAGVSNVSVPPPQP
jgi:hypothetical protein